ncbi:hypothetical protein M3Y99_00650900 [Aphelenchoides fujianensis]|nr:hypothetical protein M3Y99_00650900 [Aphelenchoides fujianensis]
MAEEKCGTGQQFVTSTDPWFFHSPTNTFNGHKVELKSEGFSSPVIAVDLSAGRTLFEKKHWKVILKEGRFEKDPKDGQFYVPCTSKQTFGFSVEGAEQLEVPLAVDHTQKRRGLCLLRAGKALVWTTLSGSVLDGYCVHFAFHEKIGDEMYEEVPKGTHQLAFSKRV